MEAREDHLESPCGPRGGAAKDFDGFELASDEFHALCVVHPLTISEFLENQIWSSLEM